MEQWNNVELTNMSKSKSYTLNHDYDDAAKLNKENQVTSNGNPIGNENGNGNGETNQNKQQNKVLEPGSEIKPIVHLEDVESLVRRLYGISINDVKELKAYDDRNYLIQEDGNIKNPLIVSHCPHGYVLKILNSLDSKKVEFVDGQNQLLLYLAKQNVKCPRPIANAVGKYYSVEQLSGKSHVVRLFEFLPGKNVSRGANVEEFAIPEWGILAKLDRSLKNFTHPAYETHKSLWMLQSVPQLRDFIYAVKDQDRRTLCEEIIEAFESKVLSALDTLDDQIIHGDYNEQNIVVSLAKNGLDWSVSGVIDFGDTSKSPLIFELGIALAYMILQAKDLSSGGIFLAGFTSTQTISEKELGYLKYCVAARLAQSLIMSSYTHTLDPTNDYVLVTQAEGWRIIDELWRNNLETIDELWATTGHEYLTQSNK